jgi:serine/threonine protein kinase
MIVTENVEYPPHLTPAMVDLLQHLLSKDPERRIGIEGIKSHPWFSRDEYTTMTSLMQSDAEHLICKSTLSSALDAGILARMAEMGIDTHNISQVLLQGVETDATLCYEILRRQELVEKMGEIVAVLRVGTYVPLSPLAWSGRSSVRRVKPDGQWLVGAVVSGRRGSRGNTLPITTAVPGKAMAVRRLSKPLAIRPQPLIPRPIRENL